MYLYMTLAYNNIMYTASIHDTSILKNKSIMVDHCRVQTHQKHF